MSNLLDLLSPASMDLDLTATSTSEALAAMVGLLDAAGALADRDVFLHAVEAREAEGTTAMGDGVAIPHGKSDGAARPALAFARCPGGVSWGAGDGSPVHLVFLIAVPAAQAGDEHLRILALLARKLVNPTFRQALMDAPTVDAAREVLATI